MEKPNKVPGGTYQRPTRPSRSEEVRAGLVSPSKDQRYGSYRRCMQMMEISLADRNIAGREA